MAKLTVSRGTRLFINGIPVAAKSLRVPGPQYVYSRGAIRTFYLVHLPQDVKAVKTEGAPMEPLAMSGMVSFTVEWDVVYPAWFRLLSHPAAEAIMSAEAKPLTNGN